MLRAGAGLVAVTRSLATALQVEAAVLPMTEAEVTTRVTTDDGVDLHHEEFLVLHEAAVPVQAVRYDVLPGAGSAVPAPGALEAIAEADAVAGDGMTPDDAGRGADAAARRRVRGRAARRRARGAALIRAALVTPLTGPLAGYGRAGATALRLWSEAAPEPVRLDVYDAHPDPAAAIRRAERDHPDLLFGPYGSGPTRAVAAATARTLWNHGGARADAPHLVPVLAPAQDYLVGALRLAATGEPRPAGVVLRHGDTGFGRAVADGAAAEAQRRGLPVDRAVLPGSAPADDTGRVLLVAGDFAAERAAAEALLPGRWRAVAFVGAGVDEVLAGLGERREGLFGPAQWLPGTAPPRPDEGPPAAQFVAAYRRSTGGDPPYPAAQAFAAGLVAARCLRDAGTADDVALLAAARALDTTTLFDRFRLDPGTGRQVGHRVLTVQWQDGRRRVVGPADRAEVAPRRRPRFQG